MGNAASIIMELLCVMLCQQPYTVLYDQTQLTQFIKEHFSNVSLILCVLICVLSMA